MDRDTIANLHSLLAPALPRAGESCAVQWHRRRQDAGSDLHAPVKEVSTVVGRQPIFDALEIAASVRKHGVSDEAIVHSWENAIKLAEFEYDGEKRLFVIGPDSSGNLVELVAVPAASPTRVIHADRLRPKFYDAL